VASRIRTALLLYSFALLGTFLLIAPWTAMWERAMRGLVPAPLAGWALSGWARGIVSGLGALDLVIALQYVAELWGPSESGGSDLGA
jgi:hypothetical protein